MNVSRPASSTLASMVIDIHVAGTLSGEARERSHTRPRTRSAAHADPSACGPPSSPGGESPDEHAILHSPQGDPRRRPGRSWSPRPPPPSTRSPPTPRCPATPSGWQLVWSDDFNGANNTLPSSGQLDHRHRHVLPRRPRQLGHRRDPDLHQQHRNLRHDGAGNLRDHPDQERHGSWTSARIETGPHRLQARRPGHPAHRGPHPDAQRHRRGRAAGYWPAFWALGAPYRGNYQNWPGIGEFDIMENVNGINSVWGVLHCGVAPGGPCNEFNGIGASRACPGCTCQSAFHTYRFEWDRTNENAQQLRWYVDGQLYHTVNQSQVGSVLGPDDLARGLLHPAQRGDGRRLPERRGRVRRRRPAAPSPASRCASTTWPSTRPRAAPRRRPAAGQPAADRQPGRVRQHPGREPQRARPGHHDLRGHYVGSIGNGDWLASTASTSARRTPLDFVARVASGAAGGVSGLVEVRIDSPTTPPIGSFAIANTGGWTSWREIPGNVSGVTGTHTVYLTFTSGQPADFVNVDWFRFRR